MDEPLKDQTGVELKDWETPVLLVEDVAGVTAGGGAVPVFIDPETGGGIDPEYYAS